MINEESLHKLYEGIVNGNELTTKELNGYGFNSKDLSDLIKQGSLERVKRGYYSFLSTDELFYYGKKLIAEKEYDKATKCFKKCYELDKNHSGACFQLFLRSISKKDYELAFQYFEVLSDTENPYYSADSNFYLYLLSIITDIPDKHKEYARYLKIEDIRVDFQDKRYQDIPQQNKIRIAVLQRKFPYALKQLKDLTAKHDSLTVQDIITRTLLFQAIETETISKNTLIELAQNKSYEEIVDYLEAKQKRHNLSLIDTYTLKLVNEIINLQETQQISEKTVFQSENLFEAIDGNNYELALSLCESYNIKNNINNSKNTINLLLSDICSMIKQISSPSQTPTEIIEDQFAEETAEKVLYEQPILSETNISSSTSFPDVIGFLMKSDLENAFRTLKNYMESINKKEYEFLIVNLIKLSLIEKDKAFTKPMTALTYVSRESFKFDISNYIQEFYVTLAQNRFDEARIYLDIISNSNKLGQNCILTEELLQVLNNAESMIGYKKNNSILDNAEKAFVKSQGLNIQQSNTNSTSTKISKPITQDKSPRVTESSSEEKTVSSMKTGDSEKEFIESKHELLLNDQGMVLLRPMNNEKCKRIHYMVKEYSDMVSFSISKGDNSQIVLRYKPPFDMNLNISEIIKNAKEAYFNERYEDSIKLFKQAFALKSPKSFIYAYIGLSYLKIQNINQAIKYLTVATELSKTEDKKYNFEELIAKLKGKKISVDKDKDEDEDVKPYVEINENIFMEEKDKYYGIKNFEEIAYLVFHDGIDINTACLIFFLRDEQINIVKLIFAREYYSQKNYEFGDKLLKIVENSDKKTAFVINLLDEIRKNKKFYCNRNHGNEGKLVLSLKKNILT